MMFSVKKCELFEGASPSFRILAEPLNCAQNTHGTNKRLFTNMSKEGGKRYGKDLNCRVQEGNG